MDIVSLAITVLLAALMLYLVVRLPLAILGNLRAGHRFRQGLGAALDELRLSRMLGYLGIDKAKYLHLESSVEIQKHMQRCNACEDKEACDQVLDSDAPAVTESLGFCANIDDLKSIREPR